MQDVGRDKEGTVRAEDYTFSMQKGSENHQLRTGFFVHCTVLSAVYQRQGSCVVLRGRWCNVIVLNVHVPSEEKSDDWKTVFITNQSRLLIIFLSTVRKFYKEILMQKWRERTFGCDRIYAEGHCIQSALCCASGLQCRFVTDTSRLENIRINYKLTLD